MNQALHAKATVVNRITATFVFPKTLSSASFPIEAIICYTPIIQP